MATGQNHRLVHPFAPMPLPPIPPGSTRRSFLAQGSALFALPFVPEFGPRHRPKQTRFAKNPFTLGVASGDPEANGMVLWTRLAPSPLELDYGMAQEPVEVTWEVAHDEGFRRIETRGTTMALPELGHALHVEVEGLAPERWYFFRFRCGDAQSPVGRTRTMPAADSQPDRLRFAFASCQHFETGHFTAYEHLASQDHDLVFHLGDYIYEYKGQDDRVRKHLGGKLRTLEEYRRRHAQYRSDPLLQRAHALCPWLVTWDDHEFENNYANDISENPQTDPRLFLEQRANAYQAYYEALPLRRRSLPRGPHMQLYRRAQFGRLADLHVLDTRQYRTDQPNGDGKKELNEAAWDPRNTLLGKEQRDWLCQNLTASPARWQVLAQQVMMGLVGFPDKEGKLLRYSMDQWGGYAHERRELLQFLAERKLLNTVVLTGDIHSNWVNNLRVDDRDASGQVVATEFVGTSISSGGDGNDGAKELAQLKPHNPGLVYHNRQRGYVACTVTAKDWRSDYFVVDQVTKPGGKVSKAASFVVAAGKPGAKKA